MKVFKMNEYDWMAANTLEEAIEVYKKDYDGEIDQTELRECDLDTEGQYIEYEDEEEIEKLNNRGIDVDIMKCNYGFGSLRKFYGEWFVKVPFREAIKYYTTPCLTASAER